MTPSTIRLARTVLLLAAVSVLPPLVGRAQAQQADAEEPTGRITGRVIDARTGAGVTDVGVQVVGAVNTVTSSGAMSGIDGRYTLSRVRAGTVTLHVRRLGYQPKTITGVVIPAGGAVEQNVTLEPATVQLSATVVTAEAERGTVSAALDQQRNATGIVSAVTAEQIQRSPDSDAAQAVQRVSGVTVQDGRYVFVRGLGERYTTTSLNGSRMPSPEPERKVVPLDLFPAGLLQTITTSKTFTPDQPGDFSGASVDIRTREFPAQRQITYSLSIGANDAAFNKAIPSARGVGGEAFALAGAGRDLPAGLRSAGYLRNTPQSQYPALINSLRNAWTIDNQNGAANLSGSLSAGGTTVLGDQRVGYLLSSTYSYGQEVAVDQERAIPIIGANNEPVVANRFIGTTGRSSVLWGGIANVSTLLGDRHRVSWNNTYTRTADDEARFEIGNIEAELNLPVDISRMRYIERSVYSSQLTGEHAFGANQQIDWSGSFAGVMRDEPDRSELSYVRAEDPSTGELRRLWYNTGQGAVRMFSELAEQSYELRGNYQLSFGPLHRRHLLKVGGLGRYTDRTSDSRVYGIAGDNLTEAQRSLPPEEILGGQFSQPGSNALDLRVLGQGGSYDAQDALGAGYAMVDYAVTDRLRLIGGARVEASNVEVNALSSLGERIESTPSYLDVLPSLALNYRLTATQNLRFSASQTLARPEYRELTSIITRDVAAGVFQRGNPNLERTLIQNGDLRWEWYPSRGEVISLAAFVKNFEKPIERTYAQQGSTVISDIVNAEGATNYGIELEMRKNLGFVGAFLTPLTLFTNLTLMESDIRLGASRGASTEPNRRMVGQAPYVLNSGLTYLSSGGRMSATVLYNRVGPRIREAGVQPLPSSIDEARDVVDFSLRLPLRGGIAARFDARNLFDSPFLATQGDVIRERWRSGRTYQLGLSWRS
jgi:outer membrane receptor for ferrienterochelin and colicin